MRETVNTHPFTNLVIINGSFSLIILFKLSWTTHSSNYLANTIYCNILIYFWILSHFLLLISTTHLNVY